jgi:PAS domain S-box-containing protein
MEAAPTLRRRGGPVPLWLPATPSLWLAYGVAAGAMLLAFFAALALRVTLGFEPLPLFLAAVMFAAWHGGLGPGLTATWLGTLLHAYFLLPPAYSLAIATVDTALELAVFVLVAVLISSLNARLRAARLQAEAAQRRLLFLAEASRHLAATLDYERALATIPRLALPELADGCAVAVAGAGDAVRWLAVTHRDPDREVVWRALLDRAPHEPAPPVDVRRVLRLGQSERAPAVDEALLAAAGRSPEQRALWRRLGIGAALVVPLTGRGRSFGVLALLADDPRRFGPAERALAEDLAGRAAAAADTACLFGEVRAALAREQAARTRAEALAAERAAILSQIADGVVIADPAGRITFANPAAERLLGLTDPDRLLVWAALPAPAAPAESPLVQAVRSGEPVAGVEWRLRRPDGSETIVQGCAAPVLADDGARLGAVLTLRDVTAERDLERQKDEFFSHISHDLRTPITAIKASLGAVLVHAPPALPAPLRELLINADDAADRMARLVNDLLELTRLRAGRVQLRRAAVDLRQVAERSARLIEPLARARGQRLVLALPEAPVMATADAERLERILINLLTNAHQYGREGGLIELRLVALSGEARLGVIDDGPGIPAAAQARIFERFYRGEAAGAARLPGSGLGLAIASALTALHGGRIWVESWPGAGAAFWVALPSDGAPGAGRAEA